MRTYEETIERVLRARDEYEIRQAKQRTKLIKAAVVVIAAASAGAVSIPAARQIKKNETGESVAQTAPWTSHDLLTKAETSPGLTDGEKAKDEQTSGKKAVTERSKVTPEAKEKGAGTTAGKAADGGAQKGVEPKTAAEHGAEAISDPPKAESATEGGGSGGSYSGGSGALGSQLAGLNIRIDGDEFISREEAAEHVRANAPSIASSLTADPVIGPGELTFSTKGYSHIKVSEKGGLSANCGQLDMPVTRDGRVVAVVTVYSVNGKLYDSVSYGGPGLRQLDAAFRENPNDKLAFIYLENSPEVIVTESNKLYFNPAPAEYEKGVDYYYLLSENFNTFSRADLFDGAVTVK